MAKFVVAGKANCPHFAKVELLADYLQKNLPTFNLHKIVVHPDDWESWLQATCKKNDWNYSRSPVVWRELVDRGGKGMLIGGFNEFMEHAWAYYAITSDMLTDEMLNIAEENLETKEVVMVEEAYYLSLIQPLHIWIVSASSLVCNNLIPLLCTGEIFGSETEVSLHLLDDDNTRDLLFALQMEAEDLAYPLLRKVTVHTDLREAFSDADVIIMLDDVILQEIQSHADMIGPIANQCKKYGDLIEQNAKRNVKVLVAGNTFVNLRTYVIMQNAPSVPQCNFVGLAKQLESQVQGNLARKLNVNPSGVKDVIIWGNISGSTFIDLQRARVYGHDSAVWGPPDFSRPVKQMVYDSNWLETEFISDLNTRLQTVETKLQHPSGILPADGIYTMLRYWYQGSPPDEVISVGVISEGNKHCVVRTTSTTIRTQSLNQLLPQFFDILEHDGISQVVSILLLKTVFH
nr:PREDICTED: putative malate dehydrogenase 1B isoform X2 [Latimeria chalumnae]|eukprot:XP_014351387.1 PREDICTED: putative malate dehydrogenase 1B isoform X2 [Latimeria chalumnae]